MGSRIGVIRVLEVVVGHEGDVEGVVGHNGVCHTDVLGCNSCSTPQTSVRQLGVQHASDALLVVVGTAIERRPLHYSNAIPCKQWWRIWITAPSSMALHMTV